MANEGSVMGSIPIRGGRVGSHTGPRLARKRREPTESTEKRKSFSEAKGVTAAAVYVLGALSADRDGLAQLVPGSDGEQREA